MGEEQKGVSRMLWAGRFGSGPHADLMRLTSSIDVDIALLECDARATKAHARVLEKAGLLDASELEEIDRVLDDLVTKWRAGDLRPAEDDEDVHLLVERTLTDELGGTGKRIHAGRSRNDLVATDLRLWCRDAAAELSAACSTLIHVLADLALDHVDSVMPGYTHLQRAQPVSLGFHLCAHGVALARDKRRFELARESADVSALGAGALAGTTLPLAPQVAADEMGFASVFVNAMDAVSDRDFAADLLYAVALCSVHLSRLAEEVVLWASAEYGFARLSDEWSTGSSMMPQKRNPDVAELVRGRAAPAVGELNSLLVLLKGLPLAYDRDLQEDKGIVFRAVVRAAGCLEAMSKLLPSLTFDVDRMRAAAAGAGAWATDAAEALVSRGVPFREAHEATGALVADLDARGLSLADATEDMLTSAHPSFVAEDVGLADPMRGMESRETPGGAAPTRVREQVAKLRELADG